MFDFKYKTLKDRNSAVIMIVGYIYAVCISKNNRYNKREICDFVKGKLCYDRCILKNL